MLFVHRHVLGSAGHDLGGDSADDTADVALQTAHAGLAGIAFDDIAERRIQKSSMLGFQAIGLKLPRDQIALGDIQLVRGRIPGDFDHLHAVAQRSGHRVHRVGRRNEQHLGEIERHVEVVIGERIVLRWIEHLQQR